MIFKAHVLRDSVVVIVMKGEKKEKSKEEITQLQKSSSVGGRVCEYGRGVCCVCEGYNGGECCFVVGQNKDAWKQLASSRPPQLQPWGM